MNPSTGAVAFRGIVPNADRSLLPGMYVTVRLIAGALNKGYELPQLAVQRDAQGAFVLVAGADGTVVAKRVEVVSTVGVNWAVNGGLADGDQVIVSGLQLAFPGGKVTAKPAGEAPGAPATATAAGS